MNYAVVGGEGFLGQAIISAVIEAVPEAHAVSLGRSQHHTYTNERVSFVKMDLSDAQSVDKAIAACAPKVLFHTASPHHDASRDLCESVNIAGTHHILDACRRHKVPVLVFTSSATVAMGRAGFLHNAPDSVPAHEDDPDPYICTKASAERLVLSANSAGLKTVALRLPGIYGPGDRQVLVGMMDVLKKGQARFRLGDGSTRMDLCPVSNAADAHVLAAKYLLSHEGRNEIAGTVLNVSSGDPVSLNEFMQKVWTEYDAAQLPSFYIPVPVALVLVFAYVLEFLYALVGKVPIMTPSRVRYATNDFFLDISRTQRALGYAPRKRRDEAIKEAVTWYKKAEAGGEKGKAETAKEK